MLIGGINMEERRKRKMIKELKNKFKSIRFDFMEENHSLQLLHDSLDLRNNDEFLDKICDIAIKHLNEQEQMIFAILFDYYDDIKDFKFDYKLLYGNCEYYSTSNIEKALSCFEFAKDSEVGLAKEDIAA
jgi:hypothetical protein